MKIQILELNNFRKYEGLKIVFPQENFLVLIGPNGGGKTTILDALSYCFSHITGQLFYDHPKYKVETMLNNDDIQVGKNIATCIAKVNWPNIDLKIVVSKKLNETDTSYDIEPDNFLLSIRKQIKEDKFFNLPVLHYYRTNRTDISYTHIPLDPTYDSRLWAYSHGFSKSISSFKDFEFWYSAVSKIGHNSTSKQFQIGSLNRLILSLLNNLNDENKYQDIRLTHSNPTEPAIADQYRIEIKIENSWIKLRNISSGEKYLILLIGDIARRLLVSNNGTEDSFKGFGIILIDEIELHLHPSWQRKVIEAITTSFPNIQFIFSTHSPQVLSSVSDENILILDKDKWYTTGINPHGKDSNSILEELMSTSKRPKDIENKIQKLLENLAIEKKISIESQKLFNEIEQELSADDHTLARLKIKMELL
jgi:predicted ATP-binding protein involved in virulence